MNSLENIESLFPTEQTCLEYLEQVRWGGMVTSPFSFTGKVYKCANGMYRCRDTARYFSAKTGTIFQNSRVPLQKWFKAIWLLQQDPAITSVKLAEELEITQKSAWLLQQRIRKHLGLRKKSAAATEEVPATEQDKFNLLDWLSALKK